MVAEKRESVRHGDRGQSLLEFLILLPALLGFTTLLYRANLAVQMAIVNQQYARAQALFLAFNSPHYPELRFRARQGWETSGVSRLVMGVSENRPEESEGDAPAASEFSILRPGQQAPGVGLPGEFTGKIRVYNTVELCTQSDAVRDPAGGIVPTRQLASHAKPGEVDFMFCTQPYAVGGGRGREGDRGN